MAIIKWTPMPTAPLDDVDRFFDEAWLPVFGRSDRFAPTVDVYEKQDAIVVEAQLPDIDPANVNVTVEDNVITLTGQTEHKREVDDKQFYRREIRRGAFTRSIALPKAVKADSAEATYENGVLTITLPKADEAKTKTITIKPKKA